MKKRKPGRPVGTLKYPWDKIKKSKLFIPGKDFAIEKEESFRSAAYQYANSRGLSFKIKCLPEGLKIYNLT